MPVHAFTSIFQQSEQRFVKFIHTVTASSEAVSWLSGSLTSCGTLSGFKGDQILLTPNLTALRLQEWIRLSGLMGTQHHSVSV